MKYANNSAGNKILELRWICIDDGKSSEDSAGSFVEEHTYYCDAVSTSSGGGGVQAPILD